MHISHPENVYLIINTGYSIWFQLWYAYAKTIAEQEAWKEAEESGIDLVVVNPSFVVGPLLAPQPTSTLQIILAIVKGHNLSFLLYHLRLLYRK